MRPDSEVQRLRDEGAPKQVIDVAEEVVRRHAARLPQSPDHRDILFNYARRRAEQDRYGK